MDKQELKQPTNNQDDNQDDIAFAMQLRRLLISMATLIHRRYNSQVLLVILNGPPKAGV